MLKDLVYRTRSYRRFDQTYAISEQTLRELVDLGRVSASGKNRQPLKYMLSCQPAKTLWSSPTCTGLRCSGTGPAHQKASVLPPTSPSWATGRSALKKGAITASPRRA